MFQEPLAIYKMIVLYMLNRVNFPLTKAQIMGFILDREYTDYLTLLLVIGELIDDELILTESVRTRTNLVITAAGCDALADFQNSIGDSLRQEIEAFFQENELELRDSAAVFADYGKSASGEYEARLTAMDGTITLVDITLSVPDEGTAISICENWQEKNQEVYKFLVESLF
jgi:hypothetical protein